MVGSGILLFLWGTTIANCLVLQNGEPCKDGDKQLVLDEPMIAGHVLKDQASLQPMALPSVRVPPFAPPFMKQGTNLFYILQFMTPGHLIPTAISNVIDNKKENLPKPEILFPETPQYISQVPTIMVLNEMENSETKPVKIPQAPELPPVANGLFEVQSAARPIIVEKPAESSRAMDLPPPPELPLSFNDVLTPVLPPFTLPALPVLSGIPTGPGTNLIEIPEPPMPLHPTVNPAVPDFETEFLSEPKPIKIPEAPTLPPFTKPELPVHVIVPAPPRFPAFAEIKPVPVEISVPCFPESNQIGPISELKPIPPPPELTPIQISNIPAFLDETFKPEHVVIPEAPELPPISNEVIEYEPIHIPQAPELSLFTLPELPTVIPISVIPEKPYQEIPIPLKEIPAPPVLPFLTQSIPTVAEAPEQVLNFKPIDIPSAPKLPSLTMPTFPVPFAIEEKNEELCDEDTPSENVAPTVIMPEVPLVASGYSPLTQPIFWAQNIIIERVLPHIFVSDKDHMKNLEVGTSYPVNSIPCSISCSH